MDNENVVFIHHGILYKIKEKQSNFRKIPLNREYNIKQDNPNSEGKKERKKH